MLIRLAHGSFDVFSKAKHVASTRLAAGLYMSFLGFRMRTKSFIFIHLSSTVSSLGICSFVFASSSYTFKNPISESDWKAHVSFLVFHLFFHYTVGTFPACSSLSLVLIDRMLSALPFVSDLNDSPRGFFS